MKIVEIGPIKIGATKTVSDPVDIIPGLQMDGPSRSVLGLSRGLADSGHEVGIYSTRPISGVGNDYFSDICLIGSEPAPSNRLFGSADHIVDQIEAAFGVPDIINFHDVYDFVQCRIARSLRRRGWAYTCTPRGGLRPIPQQRSRFKKRVANALIFKQFLRGAKFVTALCDEEAADIRKFDSKLQTIIAPNGITDKMMNEARRFESSSSQAQGRIKLGFIGQIDIDIKGIDILLEALDRFEKSSSEGVFELILAGGFKTRNKKKSDDSRAIVEKYQAVFESDRFKVPGPILGNKKWQMLSDIDVFVLTSRTEGMPVGVLEALAFGKPCLLTKGTNMAEVVSQAGAGWGCETSVESVLAGLRRVAATTAEERQKMGQNAVALIEDRFRWTSAAQTFVTEAQAMLRQ